MKDSQDILAVNIVSAAKDILKYWYILIITLVLSMTIAFFYVKFAARTYSVGSSIIINLESNRGGAGGGNNDFLQAFDFMGNERNLNNEIFFMQSIPLVNEVVKEMDLRTFYYLQNANFPKNFSFSLQNIYKESPILVIPQNDHRQAVNLKFYVEIIDDEKFYISAEGENVALIDLQTERIVGRVPEFELSGIYNFGSQVKNDYTSFQVLQNSTFDPEKNKDKSLFFKFNNLNQLASSFKSALSIETEGRESTMANLRMETENPTLGLDFLNKLIDKYIEKNMEEANFLANKTIEHIENQLVDVSDDLSASEQQLQNLRRSRNVMNIEEKSQNIYQQMATLRMRKEEVERRFNNLRQLNDYFMQYKDSAGILAPSALGIEDPILNNLITELTALNTEKQRIIDQRQLRNPRLVVLNNSIENLKNTISENLSFGLSTTREEITDLDQRMASLEGEFSALPGTQRALLGIERRFNLNDAIYTSLLEKRIQAQITRAAKLPDAKIIEPPRYGGVASPKGMILYAIALMAGLGIPGAIIIAIKLITNKISSKEDISLLTDVNSIASIPYSSNPEESLVMNFPQSAMAESYYILRSNLIYFLKGEAQKTIVVTSSVPGEGKSFNAFNLATSFAFANSKTILVEFDLRKPSNVMGGANSNGLPGLSSYLINRASLEEVIIKTEAPNLDVIQSGQIPPNPIELISGERTGELLEELKQLYDYVIIDTPPYGLLTDSFVLMNHADITLYIARLGFTKKNILAQNMEDLVERKKLSNLYLLLNGESEKKLTYGYGNYQYFNKKRKNTNVSKSKKLTSV